MELFLQDLRYGFRQLVKNPGFAIIAILTLGLGIGANTALFTVVNGVLIDPLPFSKPNQLVAVASKTADFQESSISFPNLEDWQKENRVFTGLAGYRPNDYVLIGTGEPERIHGEMISADYFAVLGVNPIIGRLFTKDEDRAGAQPVVLLDEGYWKTKFGGSPAVLGRNLTLNGQGYTIIGVVHGRVPFTDPVEVFVPVGQWTDPLFRDRRTGMGMRAIARMKPGVTLPQAQADMEGIARSLAEAYPEADKGSGIFMQSLKKDIVGDVQVSLFVLLGAVGFVLLIACANVANLLLARSAGRSREFAIRVAIGANTNRVVRQLLTESVLLGIGGGLLGLAFAHWGTRIVLSAMPSTLPRSDNIHLDVRVLLFNLGLSLVAAIIFGLAPALKTLKPDMAGTLKEGGRGSSNSRHRLQNVLVVMEMALSIVLLVGAGLMIRTLRALGSINPGFNPHQVITFATTFPAGRFNNADVGRAALRELNSRFKAVPCIEAVSEMGGSLPMQGDSELPIWIEGKPKPATENEMPYVLWYAVGPEYFKVMQIPLLRGRVFSEQDLATKHMVGLIDEHFAQQFFPHEDPIGKRINTSLVPMQLEIIGVVGHIDHWGLGDKGHPTLQSQFYMPMSNFPDSVFPLLNSGTVMVARTTSDPSGYASAIRQAALQYDPSQVVYDFIPMDKIVADSIGIQRFTMALLGVFSLLALILSGVGIYGVISYVAGQRTNEIGIRVALGAQRRDILRMVVGEGMRVALLGILIGVTAALALTRLMNNLIFGVGAWDPVTFIGVVTVLGTVAVAACYVPAQRATRIDPIIALRYE
jgi:predicted permease